MKPADPKSMPPTLGSTKADFIQLMAAAIWNVLGSQVTYEARNLIIAHAAYESGWGKTTAYRDGYNPFNITRLASDPGLVVQGPDTECDPNNNCVAITQRFAAYPSLDAAFQDYLNFISRSRYGNAKSLLLQGSLDFLSPLYAGGYFTQPLPIYYSNMQSVLNSVASTAAEYGV